jgi:hypothetical protein
VAKRFYLWVNDKTLREVHGFDVPDGDRPSRYAIRVGQRGSRARLWYEDSGTDDYGFRAVALMGQSHTTQKDQRAEGDDVMEVIIVGENGVKTKVDATVAALKVIDTLHAEIHAGETFHVARLVEDVANNASIDLLIVVGATKKLHLTMVGTAAGDAHAYLYETPTTSAAGTAVTAHNKNRGSSDTTTATITHTPTVSAPGTALDTALIPGGTKQQATGSSGAQRDEWILKKSTTYLLRLTNKAGSAKDMSVGLTWYEEE